MKQESLLGWLAVSLLVGVLGGAALAFGASVDGKAGIALILGGLVAAVPASIAAQVLTIGLGVQVGMARHEHLQGRR